MKKFLLLFLLITLSNNYPQDLYNKNNQYLNKDEIVASVDTINITTEEFFYSYEFGPVFPKRGDESKSVHLKYMINEKLLALQGFKEGLLENESVKEVFNDIKYDLAAEELFKDEIVPKVEITENEIDKIIEKKLTEYEIRWLYAEDRQSIENYYTQLSNKNLFDTLFYNQLNDSVSIDDRLMKNSLYYIYIKNPLFAQIIDTLKSGESSPPIHTNDGWYIIKIDNVWKSLINTETEQNKLRSEAIEALTQSKMGILSGRYVDSLFDYEKPVIKRDAFTFLRSYLGKFILSPEKYSEWALDSRLDTALSNLGLKRSDKYPGINLVVGADHNYTIEEFIVWYRNRESFVKFRQNNLKEFSQSLEKLIWVMVRDKLLMKIAVQKGYADDPWVKKQSIWWMDKIAYSAYRDELAKSITLSSSEINLSDKGKEIDSESMNQMLTEKVLHKILELKSKYKININDDLLNQIKVSSENDKSAIDMYIVKRGNLIPRLAFPSIDNEWAGWE